MANIDRTFAKQEEQRRRPYTWEEAKKLLGRRLERVYPTLGGGIGKVCEIVSKVTLSYDGKTVYVNDWDQTGLINGDAKLDGEPFGMLREAR